MRAAHQSVQWPLSRCHEKQTIIAQAEGQHHPKTDRALLREERILAAEKDASISALLTGAVRVVNPFKF
jgi:hypothetical protein